MRHNDNSEKIIRALMSGETKEIMRTTFEVVDSHIPPSTKLHPVYSSGFAATMRIIDQEKETANARSEKAYKYLMGFGLTFLATIAFTSGFGSVFDPKKNPLMTTGASVIFELAFMAGYIARKEEEENDRKDD